MSRSCSTVEPVNAVCPCPARSGPSGARAPIDVGSRSTTGSNPSAGRSFPATRRAPGRRASGRTGGRDPPYRSVPPSGVFDGDLHEDLAPPAFVEPDVVALDHRRPLVLRVRVVDEPLVDRVHGPLEGAQREEAHLRRALPGDQLTVAVHHELLPDLVTSVASVGLDDLGHDA